MASTPTSTALEASTTEVGGKSMEDNENEKENCNRIRGGETYEIFGKKVDFADVYDEFKKYCCVRKEVTLNEKSHALDFAYRMLFQAGPSANKNKTKVYVANFMFPVMVPALDENGQQFEDDNGETVLATKPGNEFKTVIVTNRKNPELSTENDDCMILSLEHACLIALEIMKPVFRLALISEPRKFFLTPLAVTVYSPQSIETMATIFATDLDEMVIKVNCSAQSSGHLLDSSDINCAVACTLFGSKNITDPEKRYRIIERTMNGYNNRGDVHDITHMNIYVLFAMGGYFDEPTKAALDKWHDQFQSVGNEMAGDNQVPDAEQVLVRLMKYLASVGCKNAPDLLKVFEFGADGDLNDLCDENGMEMDNIEFPVDWSKLANQFGKYFYKPNIEKMVESLLAIGDALHSK